MWDTETAPAHLFYLESRIKRAYHALSIKIPYVLGLITTRSFSKPITWHQ